LGNNGCGGCCVPGSNIFNSPPRKEYKKRGIGSNVLKEDSRRGKMSAVPARIAKGPEDRFELSMAEITRHVGVTTSGIAKAVAPLEEEG